MTFVLTGYDAAMFAKCSVHMFCPCSINLVYRSLCKQALPTRASLLPSSKVSFAYTLHRECHWRHRLKRASLCGIPPLTLLHVQALGKMRTFMPHTNPMRQQRMCPLSAQASPHRTAQAHAANMTINTTINREAAHGSSTTQMPTAAGRPATEPADAASVATSSQPPEPADAPSTAASSAPLGLADGHSAATELLQKIEDLAEKGKDAPDAERNVLVATVSETAPDMLLLPRQAVRLMSLLGSTALPLDTCASSVCSAVQRALPKLSLSQLLKVVELCDAQQCDATAQLSAAAEDAYVNFNMPRQCARRLLDARGAFWTPYVKEYIKRAPEKARRLVERALLATGDLNDVEAAATLFAAMCLRMTVHGEHVHALLATACTLQMRAIPWQPLEVWAVLAVVHSCGATRNGKAVPGLSGFVSSRRSGDIAPRLQRLLQATPDALAAFDSPRSFPVAAVAAGISIVAPHITTTASMRDAQAAYDATHAAIAQRADDMSAADSMIAMQSCAELELQLPCGGSHNWLPQVVQRILPELNAEQLIVVMDNISDLTVAPSAALPADAVSHIATKALADAASHSNPPVAAALRCGVVRLSPPDAILQAALEPMFKSKVNASKLCSALHAAACAIAHGRGSAVSESAMLTALQRLEDVGWDAVPKNARRGVRN